ncbi:GNAT family N-acetyltransferase [Tamlana agarivorans]|uniref:GNAT family N-acetyltransferase n=1 Tax=Pseudotamlana agarivorans TaxID=481183 RepID=A0ACC5U7A8_9FLAO|nr:GNAT family N-acetyltransferase [Tamlana agarivorans]MBU2950189.1 GNAT family N-acetyltransferase [Tamlana agarivorans]
MTHDLSNYAVVKYTDSYYDQWNEFVSVAKNATFLFHRDFMTYHKDRFEDFSLLVFKKNKLLAVLPANRVGKTLHSHQGLTYGGVVLQSSVKFSVVLELFFHILKYLNSCKLEMLQLKQIPSIYTNYPTEEIDYLLFVLQAELVKKDTLSVVDLARKLKISGNRMEGVKRGRKNDLLVKEEQEFDLFWNKILIPNLKNKHNASPVHSLSEITLLKSRFPNSIRQFNVYHEGKIVAGTTVFETERVAHSQYISGDENKNVLGSLDFLHQYLIDVIYKDTCYFDFGNSNEGNGLKINKGLQYWKEGFGARTVTQDFYKINIKNYHFINAVFI